LVLRISFPLSVIKIMNLNRIILIPSKMGNELVQSKVFKSFLYLEDMLILS